MPQRDLYIDRLRSVLIAIVLLHHAAFTYGAPGHWFRYDPHAHRTNTGVILATFTATNQAFLVGLFFLLAAYYSPRSLERKGYARFLRDRVLRLGLPLLAFGFVIGPVAGSIANLEKGESLRRTFTSTFSWLWYNRRFMNGPLWFTETLLIFTFAYCVWRVLLRTPLTQTERKPSPIPRFSWWLFTALTVGAASLAIRQVVPASVEVFGLQLGYFASYIFLFPVGIAAWRNDWLRQLDWKTIRPAALTTLFVWPLFPFVVVLVHALYPYPGISYIGGLTWTAIFFAFWEPLVAWGLIALCLVLFKERMNQPSRFWAWINRRSYAVYILHAPVLVALSLFLRFWPVPILLKFAVTGISTCVATWLIADLAIRLPGVQRVL